MGHCDQASRRTVTPPGAASWRNVGRLSPANEPPSQTWQTPLTRLLPSVMLSHNNHQPALLCSSLPLETVMALGSWQWLLMSLSWYALFTFLQDACSESDRHSAVYSTSLSKAISAADDKVCFTSYRKVNTHR